MLPVPKKDCSCTGHDSHARVQFCSLGIQSDYRLWQSLKKCKSNLGVWKRMLQRETVRLLTLVFVHLVIKGDAID